MKLFGRAPHSASIPERCVLRTWETATNSPNIISGCPWIPWLIVVIAIACVPLAHGEGPEYATLRVRVEGIRDRKGEIGVALFNSPKGYPAHTEHAYEAEWVGLSKGQSTADVVFEGVPFGEYAVSVLHDENGNRKLERTTLGFPKEGVGFSNGQMVKLSAPKFKPSAFTLSEPERQLVIPLEYRD